jgi:hypothetical protein
VNLVKNVDGEWSTAKGRVRQDLDSIQRAYNALQAQFDALYKQVNTAAPVPAATISASNQVTVPTGDFLSVVATNGGLTGNGTAADPLIATGGGVTVAAAGALSGVGTPASPLSVNVDGVTMSINGSNQLVASAGSSLPVFSTVAAITPNALINSFTTPVTLVAAPGAGLYLMPLQATIVIRKPGASFEIAPNPTYSFLYSGAGATGWASSIAPGTGSAWTEWFSMLTINQFTDFANIRSNQGLTIRGNLNGGAWFPNTAGITINIGILYTVYTL